MAVSKLPHYVLATGAKMPKIGLGTWQQSNTVPGKEGSDAHEVYDAVKHALKVGYRHIDTAWAYFNEKEVGKALNEAFAQGTVKREDVFVTTKLYSRFHRQGDVTKVLKTQLQDLGLDYVDMYLIHGPVALQVDPENPSSIFPIKDGKILSDNVDHLETWAGMEDAYNQGLTKAIGLSNFNSRQIQNIHDHSKVKPHCLQVEAHAYFPQFELSDFCRNLGMAFMAYAPIGSPGAGAMVAAMGGEFPILIKDPVVTKIAEKHQKTVAQVLIRWLYERDLVVIPKSTNHDRIQQNFEIFDFELTPDEFQELSQLKKGRLLGSAFAVMKDHPQYPYSDPY